jgi:hypothetical protein
MIMLKFFAASVLGENRLKFTSALVRGMKFLYVAFAFALVNPVGSMGQFITSNKGDQEAQSLSSAQTARNTGTDVLRWADQSGRYGIQVMVWDGRRAQFSWDADLAGTSNKGSIDLLQFGYTEYCDPDVVVAEKKDGATYAMVVGIAKKTVDLIEGGTVQLDYILATSFVYVGSGFSPTPVSMCWMGQAKPEREFNPDNFASKGRRCFSPNIDGNEFGQVAITWAEEESNSVRVTIHYPSPLTLGDIDYLTTVTHGNVFGMEGLIDGSPSDGKVCFKTSCNKYSQIVDGDGMVQPADVAIGYPVGQEGEVANGVEKNLFVYAAPDVAISEIVKDEFGKEFTNISFSYLRNSGMGQVQPTLPIGLMVYQKDFGKCPEYKTRDEDPVTHITTRFGEDWLRNNLSGPPRIASTASTNLDFYRDYTVVQGNGGLGCDDGGYYWTSEIYAWTKRSGILNDQPGSLLNDIDIHDKLCQLPVVTHISSDLQSGSLNKPNMQG